MFHSLQSVAIVLAVTAASSLAGAPQRDTPVAPLTTQGFAAACQQTLTSHDHDFATGVSAADGCGCFANALGQNENTNLLATSVVLREVVATDSTMEPDWSAIALTAGVDDATLGQILQTTHAALGQCMQA